MLKLYLHIFVINLISLESRILIETEEPEATDAPDIETEEPEYYCLWHAPCGQSRYSDAAERFRGRKRFIRIVSGDTARRNEFPWHVQIQHIVPAQSSPVYICGGVIVAREFVVTAAHCVEPFVRSPTSLAVLAGEHSLNVAEGPETTVQVTQVRIHHQYVHTTLQNDIAILRVSPAFLFNHNIQPACQPDPELTELEDELGQLTGWGTLTTPVTREMIPSEELQWAQMRIKPDFECQMEMGTFPTEICAYNIRHSSACKGDSGGPLTWKNDNDTFELIGITSWGVDCSGNFPTVFTRVSSYIVWICDSMAAMMG